MPEQSPPRDSAPPPIVGRTSAIRALGNRNYRLFFGGQGISLVGTWMQNLALQWLVWQLTKNPLWLGVLGFSSQILSFAVAPFAGVVADRWRKHRLLLWTQSLSLVQAGVLALLVFTGWVQFWHVLVLAAFLGLVNGFDIPIRQSFVVEMLERREDLPNAIALNSFIFNGARLIGPVIAGVLIYYVGEANCFLINAISYLAVLAALLMMRFNPAAKRKMPPRHVWDALREGYNYAFGFEPIRDMLLLLAAIGLVGHQYQSLMSAFADHTLHGGAKTYGWLVSSVGVGALLGAVYLARRRSVLGLDRVIGLAPILLGFSLIGLAYCRYVPLALGLLVLLGFGVMTQMASTNTLLQSMIDDDKRGRVMSFYTLSFVGTAPFGSLWIGHFAARYSIPSAYFVSGCLCIVCGLVFLARLGRFRQAAQPVYERLGLIKRN